MLLEVVDHLEVELRVLVGVEGELADECVEVLDEVAVDGDLGFLLDEGDGFGDYPLLGGDACDALVHQRETE